jgi:hypothetical protein
VGLPDDRRLKIRQLRRQRIGLGPVQSNVNSHKAEACGMAQPECMFSPTAATPLHYDHLYLEVLASNCRSKVVHQSRHFELEREIHRMIALLSYLRAPFDI